MPLTDNVIYLKSAFEFIVIVLAPGCSDFPPQKERFSVARIWKLLLRSIIDADASGDPTHRNHDPCYARFVLEAIMMSC